MKKATMTIDGKRSRRTRWVTYSVEYIGERHALLRLDTQLKRPDLFWAGSPNGRFEVEYWAGDDSYLHGEKVEPGTHQTKIRIPKLDGWESRMSTGGRYSIEILLEKGAK